jgi:hypothetical protein
MYELPCLTLITKIQINNIQYTWLQKIGLGVEKIVWVSSRLVSECSVYYAAWFEQMSVYIPDANV